MPFLKIIVHFVWSVKNRKSLLHKAAKDALCDHIRENAKAKGIHVLNVNGDLDHLHVLVSYDSHQNTETLAQLLKGESSYWANRNLQLSEKLEWQDEYFAVSVSGKEFGEVYAYIDNQEAHHAHKTFDQEYEELMRKYGFDERR